MGDQLALRPPREDDLTIIEMLTQDPQTTGEFAWFGWHDPLRWRRGWDENRLLGDAGGVLMAVRADRPLGFVNWRRHQATVAGFYWETGIAVLAGARGHGDGTQAHRLLARYLFAHNYRAPHRGQHRDGQPGRAPRPGEGRLHRRGRRPRHRLARRPVARRHHLQPPPHRPPLTRIPLLTTP